MSLVGLLPNWIQLENGIVVNSTIYGIPKTELLDLTVATATAILKDRGWNSTFSWYDPDGNKNGFIYFEYNSSTVSV